MSTTQLFVELLVIGLGASIWIALGVAIFAGGHIRLSELWSDKAFILPLMAAAYAVGIVLDRLVWRLFSPLEDRIEAQIVGTLGVPRSTLVKSVMNRSETLANDLYYTRSRLRICRAWVLNGLLITVLFLVWGQAERRLSLTQTLAIGVAGGVFVGCSYWAARQFMIDYYKNLLTSYEFLRAEDAPGKPR
jgi:hypothetical protein